MALRGHKKDASYTKARHQHIYSIYEEVLRELDSSPMQGLNQAISKTWLYETVAERTGYSPEWVRNVVCRMLKK